MSERCANTPPMSSLSPSPSPSLPDISVPGPQQIHDHFAPYQRISPPWTFYERLKTLLVAIFILPFRVIYLLLAGTFLLIIATIAMAGFPPLHPLTLDSDHHDPDKDPLLMPLAPWRKALLFLLFPIARSILFFSFAVFHIRSDHAPFSPPLTAAPAPNPSTPAFVIVANHLGYIDILVLLSRFHASFVAKGELEHTPIIGRLARALQCMFVRKGHSLTSQLVARVQATYDCHRERQICQGCPACLSKLVIFPEGTTTNGTAMVPFRTGVFNAGLPVKPVCIRFPYEQFNLSWETIRFREHLFRAMTQVVNYVHITELPVYEPSDDEKADARLYAKNVQAQMARVLDQPVVPLNRKHKFLYHSWILGNEQGESEVLRKAEDITSQDEQLLFFINNSAVDIV